MFDKKFVPEKPFSDFKWKWACLQCTEGLNDPVILLGVLFRMRKLELLNKGIKYSSDEFARELIELSKDTEESVGVDLARRTGERNLIRNSGQYWRALNLIVPGGRSGKIELTDFGRRVADRDISQTEFAAITVQTFRLPNPQVQSSEECELWLKHGLIIYPLKLILEIVCELLKHGEGYLTTEELVKIVIPLSGCHAELQDYVKLLINETEKQIAVQACGEHDDKSVQFYKEKSNGVLSVRWNAKDLINTIARICDWDLSQLSYRVNGVLVPEMNLMLFDLNEAVTMV